MQLTDFLTMACDTIDFSPYYDPELQARLNVDDFSIGSTVVDLEDSIVHIADYFDENGNGKIPVSAMVKASQLFDFYRGLNEEDFNKLAVTVDNVKRIRGIM